MSEELFNILKQYFQYARPIIAGTHESRDWDPLFIVNGGKPCSSKVVRDICIRGLKSGNSNVKVTPMSIRHTLSNIAHIAQKKAKNDNLHTFTNAIAFSIWNRSFQIKKKVQGVHHWFQHNRRCDSGFPFSPGAAACIRVPKNVHVKVRAGCRLGSVVAVENVGLERLPEEDEDEDDLSNLNPPPHPPTDRHNAHNRRPTAETGDLPGPYSISASSAYYSL